MPYLQKQLSVIAPTLSVTLGRHAMNVFLPDLRISQVHGQPKRIKLRLSSSQIADSRWDNEQKTNSQLPTPSPQELVILPLYHPAVALYNNAMRKILEQDFAKIPKLLKQLNN